MLVTVAPPLELACQWTVGEGLREADAVKEAEFPTHTVLFTGLPVTAGEVLSVTAWLHVLLQPLVPVIVRFSVNEPDAPAFTLTDWPVVAPGIVPLPVIDQL